MPRKKQYDQKHLTTSQRISLAAKEFRVGRTYEDFQKYIQKNPSVSVVEMDTVEGGRENSTQAFLTMFFRNCSLMLIFVLEEKTQERLHSIQAVPVTFK